MLPRITKKRLGGPTRKPADSAAIQPTDSRPTPTMPDQTPSQLLPGLIDGASFFRIFWSILLPLCKPVLATLAIIVIIDLWSDFQGPLIYLNSPEKFTVSVGLRFFNNAPDVGGEPLQHLLMAACILSMLPVILIFFLGQRFFVQVIVMSGIKG